MEKILQHDALRRISMEFDPISRTAALVAWTWWTSSKEPVPVVLYSVSLDRWDTKEAQRLLASQLRRLASEVEMGV